MLEYGDAIKQKLEYGHATMDQLENHIEKAIQGFEKDNLFIDKIDANELGIEYYHRILLGVFHQVFRSSSSFALASASLGERNQIAKDYLLHHAEEEKTHWVWILNDLAGTGYKGPDPRTLHPHYTTQGYFSYAMFLGSHFPMGRLCMAAVLEGISGSLGPKYGPRVMTLLKIKPEFMQFFKSHGELDQGHTQEVLEVIRKTELTDYEYWMMMGVAQNTAELYKSIYNAAVSP